VLVVSDLHLGSMPAASDMAATTEVAQAVEALAGPGVVVLAGDCLELLSAGVEGTALPRVELTLAAHGRLAGALHAFAAEPGRAVIYLLGNHDARLAWDRPAATTVCAALGAQLALAVQLRLHAGEGERMVRVEHGNRFDATSRFVDARDPLDSPLDHHVTRELIPAISREAWLADAADLPDPTALPRYVTSRLAYRRIVRQLRWLLLPTLVALALNAPLIWPLLDRTERGSELAAWAATSARIAGAVLADVLLVIAVLAFVTRRSWRALATVGADRRGQGANDDARAEARALIANGGAGLITGHTHRPELTSLGDGFYVNAGCGHDVVDEHSGRFGLPPVFLAHRQLSWVELEAGASLHVRVFHARSGIIGGTRLERLIAQPSPIDATSSSKPELVAVWPHGKQWPELADPALRPRRVRRLAAGAIALAGILDIASAVTPPLRDRLHVVLRLVPLAVPQVAAALVAFAGLGLLVLARGIRRGQRAAWFAALGILSGSAALHLLKGGDLEEAITALVVVVFLVYERRYFRAGGDRASQLRGVVALVGGAALATAFGTLAVEVAQMHRHRIPFLQALTAVAERLVGLNTVALPDRLDDFLGPALAAVGVGLALFAGWLLARPVVTRRRARSVDEMARAREIVHRHGGDTLDYFALRDDKEHFFWGESLVAYAVLGGVCLVSPDPIGPRSEQDELWSAFRRFTDDHGWAVAVMGAGEQWLPTYRRSGMREMYVGDEGVVDISRFTLEGGKNKALRQAVNRIANYGYTIEFHDPARLTPALADSLRTVMTESRRGQVERGFSMTLGRVFDPADTGLLLAVVSDAEGKPAAFCQYVPASEINGYSLDLMRRTDGDHPNGVTDFAVVRTIEYLRDHGYNGLGLNFATMRAHLAGESGESLGVRVERWLLKRMSDSMQIESLWRYNAKFDPDWVPRYAAYDAMEHLVAAALAVARAEGFWELPVIGRFLVPDAPDEPALQN
jgi:lysylphosphatidylglycerol synthetase-like protein (DUF2156 family)/UDP-2,3-diacylglucosamine pyrophosphatase LpxH